MAKGKKMSDVTTTYVCSTHGFRSHGKAAVQLHMDGLRDCSLGVERRPSNPADDVNERQNQLREEYVVRDLARLGGRRATAKDLKEGDRFVAPVRAESEPQIIVSVRTSKGVRDAVVYKAAERIKSGWLPSDQAVIILD